MSLTKRLPLFPVTATVDSTNMSSELTINGYRISELADKYDTPLYIYDQTTMDDAVTQYRTALQKHYPGESAITYAGKSFLCTAAAQWADRQGLWLDCTGMTELQIIAKAAKMDRSRILVHGVNKSNADLAAAVDIARVIVVDNLHELERIADLYKDVAGDERPDLWIRIRPGYAVDTHAYNQTGQEDSKFGMSLREAKTAVKYCQEHDLPLTGLHFHQGSHFHDPSPVAPALDSALDLMRSLRVEFGWLPESFSPGGGWGVPYHEDDLPHKDIDQYIEFMTVHLAQGCRKRGLPYPRLHIEPGRSLIARAGVAVYTIGTVKQTVLRRWLLIDGGLADNPRPALYRARYSALPVTDPERDDTCPVWIGGPYCESGDVIIEDLPMPDMAVGERIAVPVSGAYQLMLSSNYNGACKPAIIWLWDGGEQLVQRRQTPDDLLARDVLLPFP